VRHFNRQFSKRQKDYKRIEKRTEHIIVNMLRDGKQEFLHHTKPCPLTRKNIDFARHQNITRLIFFFCRAMIKSCLAVSILTRYHSGAYFTVRCFLKPLFPFKVNATTIRSLL